MSNTVNNATAAASTAPAPLKPNEEMWSLLMDVTNIKEDRVEDMAKLIWTAGLKAEDDFDVLANLPWVVDDIAELLKEIPAKKFQADMRSRSVVRKAPFCPVCRDAGLSAEKYTSHHIWSDENRETVICPTLLAHRCEKCGKMGHMPKYCGKSFAVDSKRYREPVAEKPKHCKVCYQAGLGEDVYSSHFTKVDGEVFCPTILNNTCHRCGKKGHTTNYCTITVRSDRFERRPVILKRPTTTHTPPPPPPRPAPRPAPRLFQPENRDPFGWMESQQILEESIILLSKAKDAKSPEECARLVQQAMDAQSYLLRNI